ncbi:prolyl 4-hydroxylase subunit alpha-1-like [Musca vetustissima]|uniref:prolyl 4-hydroxylase subunit alpha-1-like n=1 Tax=Musca vetustissima TaxID=27455 RepID=UPI002AB66EE8|nr:prolyl 4-hydroxylase subunit alpha-1-like [Musca vetustissima]
MSRRRILSLIFYFISVGNIKCNDYYTSISGLETLLMVENHYHWALIEHIDEVERLKSGLYSLIDELAMEYNKVNNNSMELYYEYPVNVFKTINRIAADWQEALKLTQQIESLKVYNETSKIPEDAVTLPTDDDLRGAARGLSRLQQIYKLDITNFTRGYIKDRNYSSEMSAYNCYILGKSLYESKEYLAASEWLLEALNMTEVIEKSFSQIENEVSSNRDKYYITHDANNVNENSEALNYGIFPYVSIVEIIEVLGPALFYGGKPELAFAVNERLLYMEPENERGQKNQELFEAKVKLNRRTRFIKSENEKEKSQDQQLYEELCNGELEQTTQVRSKLYCRYCNNNLPYYLLGPLKLEELNIDPFVAVYYDVIYDREVKEIIETSKTQIGKSAIGSNNNTKANEVRISKRSRLGYDTPVMANISKRLADITGLTMDMTENMTVTNYGIGGYYGTHNDFSESPEDDYAQSGNRILTAMFYLSDVDLGGATAFPQLRLAVPPIKHSLLVWYNLHRSLEPDYRTSHAGCPVLKGSKWIGNVWFHSVGQELVRPCDVKPDGVVSKHGY